MRITLTTLLVGATLAGCGAPQTPSMSDTKIVGGTLASAADAVTKSTVALVGADGEFFCSGSLVTSIHVVTAAHCLKDFPVGEKLTVVFGITAKNGQVPLSKKREAKKFIVHAGYDEVAMDEEEASRPPNDIAFITLKSAAPSGYTPVSVLTTRTALIAGETLTLAGFGLTSPFWGDSALLRKVDVKMINEKKTAHEIEFGESPGRSACMGDSGGPAFVRRNGKLVLVGVTSRGSGYCDDTGLYTDIRYQYDWMVAATR